MSPNPLRNFPSVNDLLESPPLKRLVGGLSRNAVVSTVRTVLDEVRSEVQTVATEMTMPSVTDLAERIARRLVEGQPSHLRPVINATGILLYSGLGGPPLAEEAIAEMSAVCRDYASLELDLTTGRPARRTLAVEALLNELTGAEAALVVNNDAAVLVLTLATMAAGREVIVSRGQLIEVGDGYRLPELVTGSGAVLREVGTTNQTRLEDYAAAIGANTAAILLVHPSNFLLVGTTEGVGLADLVQLGRQHKVPVLHHVGCGAIVDFSRFGLNGELMVRESIAAGADLTLLSGDQLLGGPQCGIILGRKSLVEKLERQPLGTALRASKATLAALAATLRLYRDPEKARLAIPLLHLLSTSADNLKNRADRLAPQIAAAPAIGAAEVVQGVAYLTGGPMPTQQLPTWGIAVKPATMTLDRLSARLRSGTPAVIGRAEGDHLLLDLRSVPPRQDMYLVAAFEALGGKGSPTEHA
jgi:L-seryl-tRNA(Ser) seleniumtransferase